MELVYADHDMQELGMLKNPEFDLAFGEDENNFECKISLKDHCCKEGYYIYAEGTEYGGIVDAIEIDSENDIVIYTGRSWHGILASKVIEPLKKEESFELTIETDGEPQLPDGYIELNYIKTTGAQYIKTGITVDQTTQIEFEGEFPNSGSSIWLFGVRDGWKDSMFELVRMSSGYRFNYGANSYDFVTETAETININGNICNVNGEQVVTATNQTFETENELYLFANNANGTATGYATDTIFKKTKIITNGTLKRNYVPCKTVPGEIGIFDLVSSTFFNNNGTEMFIAGEEVKYTETKIIAKAETTDTDGNSLINRYLTMSGDVSRCAKYVVDRIDLAPLFTFSEELADVELPTYTFKRYVDAYNGLCDMLASVGMRLAIVCEENTVKLSAVPIFDGSDGKELESDLIEYQMKKTYNNVNHLICMGSGSYADRQIVHLYLDADGNVSETQTFTGLDERIQFDGEQDEPEEEETRTAEQLAEERTLLIENGTQKLLDMQADDEIDVSFDSADDIYYIGDIVGAYDSTTDISVSAAVVKKIISIANGKTNIEYKVGAK